MFSRPTLKFSRDASFRVMVPAGKHILHGAYVNVCLEKSTLHNCCKKNMNNASEFFFISPFFLFCYCCLDLSGLVREVPIRRCTNSQAPLILAYISSFKRGSRVPLSNAKEFSGFTSSHYREVHGKVAHSSILGRTILC